jgi:hypothetical protein
MLQKCCECREGEMEEWNQNWDKIFMDEVREKKRREKRRKKEKMKCHKMFKDRKG